MTDKEEEEPSAEEEASNAKDDVNDEDSTEKEEETESISKSKGGGKPTSKEKNGSSKKRSHRDSIGSTTSEKGGGGIHAIPPLEQVEAAALKAVNEIPPFVHLSSKDSAPQLKIEEGRLTVRGGFRGYRMSRASHGVSQGNYYYEVTVLEPPPLAEIVNALPPNVKLGKTLQAQLKECWKGQEDEEKPHDTDTHPPNKKKKRQLPSQQPMLTGHVRLGWSMRTGELQAPVGYDRWSYAIRDILGSKIHNSRREDHWGGEPFYPHDVIGCAISLHPPHTEPNSKSHATDHIRFFKNGQALGQFVVSRNVRSGGAAFDSIQPGTYYPAVSSYMGGTVRVNFGPHFIYPIHASQLPSGMKLKPISEMCPPPLPPEQVLADTLKEKAFSKKNDENFLESFKEAVIAEATIRYDAYRTHIEAHIEEVRSARSERCVSTNDLPPPSSTSSANPEQPSGQGSGVQKEMTFKQKELASKPQHDSKNIDL